MILKILIIKQKNIMKYSKYFLIQSIFGVVKLTGE